MKAQCPSITTLEVAGSLRRFEETIGDIDLVCTASNPEQVLQALVSQPNVSEILGHGGTKASVVLNEGIQVDLRVVEEAHLGALLQYFTGSQQHNVRLREHAVKMGLSLNEYGITNVETGEIEEFRDEEGLYNQLGFQYVPPELRQGLTELDVARRREIPALVTPGDLKGDLHVHTNWTDGEDELEAMVTAAKDLGYEYVAITDHSVGRGITNGLTVKRLEEQEKAVDLIERDVGGIRVLHGTEGRHPRRRQRRLSRRRSQWARLGGRVDSLWQGPRTRRDDGAHHRSDAQSPRRLHLPSEHPSHKRARPHRGRLRRAIQGRR